MGENNETKIEEIKKYRGWIIFTIAIAFVLILWILNWIVVFSFFDKTAERGDFGSMFGAVSALFSGLAFSALIYTIWLQREELKLQREELKLQRKALELQAAELARQADELTKTVSIQETSLALQKDQFEYAQKVEKEGLERATNANFTQAGDIVERYNNGREITLKLRNMGLSLQALKFLVISP